MDKLVNSYIKNAKSEGTFYGGKHGYDIVSIDGTGKISGSGGELKNIIKNATKLNHAVAILIPIKFIKGD